MTKIYPNIGQTVLRLKDDLWVEDWVALVRICHGQKPNRPACEDDEVSVMVWGFTSIAESKWDRFSREDVWKYAEIKALSDFSINDSSQEDEVGRGTTIST